MDLYEKNGNILYILNVLKKYSDENHKMSAAEIGRKVEEIYDVEIDPRTIRRNINLLKYKLDFDISTREENGKGYYIGKKLPKCFTNPTKYEGHNAVNLLGDANNNDVFEPWRDYTDEEWAERCKELGFAD